jgi:hypothetical protein
MPSTDATTVPAPDSRRPRTIADFLDLFRGEIRNLEEFKTKLDEAERKFGKSEILNDLITWKADVDKLYLWENSSSIYALLGRTRFGSLPHEKASICGAIKRAEALVELTGFTYSSNMLDYLKRLGPASGRGIFKADGQPDGFALADFARHRTKLVRLHKLVQSGKAHLEPDWEKFFDSGFEEYKAYCFSRMTDKVGGSFGTRRVPSDESHRPGSGGIPEERQYDPLDPPDPFQGNTRPSFMDVEGGPESHVVQHVSIALPKFSTESLPMGSLPRLAWLFPDGRNITVSNQIYEATCVDTHIELTE